MKYKGILRELQQSIREVTQQKKGLNEVHAK